MMNPRTVLRLLLATLVVLNASDGFARGKRMAKPEPTVGAEVEGCMQNQPGMQIVTRNALNAASNSLADHVSSMAWEKFCGCFGPKHFEVVRAFKSDPKSNESGSYEQYEKQRDAIAVECAAVGVPAGRDVHPTVESHPSGNLVVNNPKFEGIVAHCVNSPLGYLTNAKVHLEVQKSPRASKAMRMNPAKYCSCYVTQMRRGLGDDVAQQYLASVRIPSSLDVIAISKSSDAAYETCTAEQIPFN